MSTLISEPGIYQHITETSYHADPVKDGSLSSTDARKLLVSPAHYRWATEHDEHKPQFDFGSAAHRMILGNGAGVTVIKADDWRSKTAREERDNAYAAGITPILQRDLEQVGQMAQVVRDHPIAAALLDRPGTTETTVIWHDRIWRRARLDIMPDLPADPNARLIIADYKTTTDASTNGFGKHAGNYGYHQQAAWYCDGITAVTGRKCALVFIAQEKTAPYVVNVIELTPDALTVGRERNERAVDVYQRCIETDEWPGYSTQIVQADLPVWTYRQHEEESSTWETN